MIRTYKDLCKTCYGKKTIANPDFDPNQTGSTTWITCPVCNGTGIIIVTEVYNDPTVTHTGPGYAIKTDDILTSGKHDPDA